MDNVPMLTILGVLPLIGALLAFVVRGKAGKQLAMAVALITLAFGLVVFFGSADSDLAETVSWIPQIGAWYALSLDGMGRARLGVAFLTWRMRHSRALELPPQR